MKRIPAIKSVMTAFPYSVDINSTIKEARRFFDEHNIHHLPVTDNKKLVGILTDRDISIFFGSDSEDKNDKKVRVKEVYIANSYIVDLNERLDIVLQTMADERIDSAIVTRQGKLVGVFTGSDACRSYAQYLRKKFLPPDGTDAA